MKAIFIAFLLFSYLSAGAQNNDNLPQKFKDFTGLDSLIGQKKYNEAIAKLDKLIKKGKSKKDSAIIAKAYNLTGNIYLMQRDFDKSLRNYFFSLDHYNIKTDTTEVSRLYTNIGTLYSILKELPKARDYYLKASTVQKNQTEDRLKTITNLASVYLELGDKRRAFTNFSEALNLAKKLKNEQIQAVLQTNLSNYFIIEKDWKSAINAAKASLGIREKLKQPVSVITLNNLGYSLVQSGQIKQGIENYQVALKSANGQEKEQLYYNIYNAYKAEKNLSPALIALESYTKTKDSLSRLNYQQKVAELAASYESLQKQNQINSLGKENTLQKQQLKQQLYLIVAAVLIILLVSVMIYIRLKHFRTKEALEKSQIKRQLLLLQLNPHFIFNALQSVQRFIYLKDQEHAMEYLNSFSKLIRLVLENSDKDLIPLDEEIEMIDNYLRLQNLSAVPTFSYEVNVEPDIEIENIEIPAMLVQPFVENAVMHGIKEHTEGKITVNFEQDLDGLHVFIHDNGKGISPDQALSNNKMHRSMGMDILNQRINEFNKEKTNTIHLTISNNETESDYPGTTVHLLFKI